MSRFVVNYDNADEFVEQQQKQGIDVGWDGWTMVFWKENDNGFSDKNGARRGDAWGVEVRVEPDSAGLWNVPVKYVASRRTRA